MSILNDQKYKTENCAYFLNGIECPYAQNVCKSIYSVNLPMDNSKKEAKRTIKCNLRLNYVIISSYMVLAPMALGACSSIKKIS